MRPARLLPLLVLTALLPAACPAQAQSIRRCVQTDGTTVFTDRHCEDLGASDRSYRPPAGVPGQSARTPLGCPRRYQDLVERVGAAIASGDVNRLASLYLWAGASGDGANRIMDRLEVLVNRPLLDIRPVLSASAPVDEAGAGAADDDPSADGPAAPAPLAIELHQRLASSRHPSSTVLGLRRSYDCLWISF
ncbi:MAG: hypothetical protein QM601_12955 [Pseudoxanthomonas sp.]